jgi:hypothetical protein
VMSLAPATFSPAWSVALIPTLSGARSQGTSPTFAAIVGESGLKGLNHV